MSNRERIAAVDQEIVTLNDLKELSDKAKDILVELRKTLPAVKKNDDKEELEDNEK